MARSRATVKIARVTSAASDGIGAATPATSRAPRMISVGAIRGPSRLGAPSILAAVGHERSRSFNAPETRKTTPKTMRAISDTGLNQLNVP